MAATAAPEMVVAVETVVVVVVVVVVYSGNDFQRFLSFIYT